MVEIKANSGVFLMKHSKIHSCICQLKHQLLLKDLFWMFHKLPSGSISKKKKKKGKKANPHIFVSQTIREVCANRSHKTSLDTKCIVKMGNLWNMVVSSNKATVQLLNSHHTTSHQDKTWTNNLRHAVRGHFPALSPLLPRRLTALFPLKDILWIQPKLLSA